MTPECIQTIKDLITYLDLECDVDSFETVVSSRWKNMWTDISRYRYLSEDFIRHFKDKLDWLFISACQKLPEEFIREFQNKVYWMQISAFQELSEDFIREFRHKVNWDIIPREHKVSENLIREFQNEINWRGVSMFQELSEDFIREFRHKVDWDLMLTCNRNIRCECFSDSFYRDFADEIKELGTKKQKQRLKDILNRTVDMTYDIIL